MTASKTSGMMKNISERTVERLSVYRRVLLQLREADDAVVFSHQLSESAGVTAAQVRRDIMHLGCSGVPNSGYRMGELLNAINALLDAPQSQRAVLVGVGHLGLALLSHFSGRWRWLHIHAAFDADPAKCNSLYRGARCYPLTEIGRIVREWRIDVGIITVPKDAAQDVADRLCAANVRGLLNFAPIRLRVPETVFVENVDLTSSFEKVAFYARHATKVVDTKEARDLAGMASTVTGTRT
jgi:redox-sensing transcriptional repressor